MNYLIIIPIAFILAAAALALPWFMVRQGYRESKSAGRRVYYRAGSGRINGRFQLCR
nr:Cobalamin biosynthesis protein CbiX [Enterobacter cloacae subsp. cloacae]